MKSFLARLNPYTKNLFSQLLYRTCPGFKQNYDMTKGKKKIQTEETKELSESDLNMAQMLKLPV